MLDENKQACVLQGGWVEQFDNLYPRFHCALIDPNVNPHLTRQPFTRACPVYAPRALCPAAALTLTLCTVHTDESCSHTHTLRTVWMLTNCCA
jgi:hypothetical protein